MADGARTPSLGSLTFPLVLEYVHDMTTVEDPALLADDVLPVGAAEGGRRADRRARRGRRPRRDACRLPEPASASSSLAETSICRRCPWLAPAGIDYDRLTSTARSGSRAVRNVQH